MGVRGWEWRERGWGWFWLSVLCLASSCHLGSQGRSKQQCLWVIWGWGGGNISLFLFVVVVFPAWLKVFHLDAGCVDVGA